jgi:hypothetical protein
MPTSPKWGIRYPASTDAPDIPLWMSRMATDLDDVAKDSQGTFASRPVSSVGTPGKSGRYYRASDLTGAPILRDFGTGWQAVSGAYGTYANRPAAATDLEGLMYYATDKWMRFLCTSGAWILIEAIAQPMTSPPTDANSVDGQRISLPLGNGRVILRYDAAGGTYRWKCEGGGGILESFAEAASTLTPATASSSTTAIGVTFPWIGDWDLDWGLAAAVGTSQSAGLTFTAAVPIFTAASSYATLQAGETDAAAPASIPANNITWGIGFATGAGFGATYYFSRKNTKTSLAVNNRAIQRYIGINGGPFQVNERYMKAVPIQITGN